MFYADEDIIKLDRRLVQMRRSDFIRLDCNENPGGLPIDFVKETLKSITPELLSQYPDTITFVTELADFLGININNICLTNGSGEGIEFIYRVFSSYGGRVVGVNPSYVMYQTFAKMFGRSFYNVNYTNNLEMPIERILEALTKETQLLILANPNNPIGNIYSNSEIEEILKIAQEKEITVAIDEAYCDFANTNLIKYAIEYDNVFVLRTFSKFYSLAGCRLGYVVGREDGVNLIQKIATPRNVNAIAMLFARTIFNNSSLMEKTQYEQLMGKALLEEFLEHNKYLHLKSNGNFILFKPKTNCEEFYELLKEKYHILVKKYNDLGILGDCVRVSTGSVKYMDVFIKAMEEIDHVG